MGFFFFFFCFRVGSSKLNSQAFNLMIRWNQLSQDYVVHSHFAFLLMDSGLMHVTMFPLVVCSNHCMKFFAFKPSRPCFRRWRSSVHSQQRSVAVVCIYVYTHTHTYMYLYTYRYMCLWYIRTVAIPVTSGEELGRVEVCDMTDAHLK